MRDQTIPPLARRTWPLIHEPSGPTRKATAAAMSSGVPSRSSGFILDMRSMSSGGFPVRKMSVAVGPGARIDGDGAAMQLLGENRRHRFDDGLGGRVDAVGFKPDAHDARRKTD